MTEIQQDMDDLPKKFRWRSPKGYAAIASITCLLALLIALLNPQQNVVPSYSSSSSPSSSTQVVEAQLKQCLSSKESAFKMIRQIKQIIY